MAHRQEPSKHLALFVVVVIGLAVATMIPVVAQVKQAAPQKPMSPGPCCSITSIDKSTVTVAAKVSSTGQTFQFKPNNLALLASMTSGEALYANFKTGQVSLNGKDIVGAIVSIGPAPTSASIQSPSPATKPPGASNLGAQGQAVSTTNIACCAISNINAAGRLVAAKDNSTNQAFEFSVPSSFPIQNLQVGEPVWANFAGHRVSLDGKTACCDIVSFGHTAAGSTGQPIANSAAARGGRSGGGRPQGFEQNLGGITKQGEPCCTVTVVNYQTAFHAWVAGAKVSSSGQTFEFELPPIPMTPPCDPVHGGPSCPPPVSVKVGQSIWANLTNGQVSLDGKTPCCKIIAEGASISSGWIRYGQVATTFPGGVTLVPLASVLHSRAPADIPTQRLAGGSTLTGGIGFPVPVNPPGQIRGATRVWTEEALRGFEGSVTVFLLDENGQPVFQASEGPWGVNGQAIPGAPSDRTLDWAEVVPADAMALARKIVIAHSNASVSKWEDTLLQAATDLGYGILAIGCILTGNVVNIGTDGFSCQPPSGGDSSDSSQAAATTVLFSKAVATQSLPHSGQMVWVNLQAKQALWTAFPITAHQQDDLGNSHYMDTSVTVFYPPVAQPGTSPRVADGSSLPVAPTVGKSAPCCGITAIDAGSRLATAKVNSTGQAFGFSVPDSVPIQNLHAGQPVWANFKARQVSLDGRTACCSIVSGPSTQSSSLSRLAESSVGKTSAGSGSVERPGVATFGGMWVPLGRVISIGPNQLSIATVVPTQERSGGAAHESSRAPAGAPAPREGPTVTVGVEMASNSTSNKSRSMAVRETTASAVATVQSASAQNTATAGAAMGREGTIMLKPVPPHPGQMVWVNRTTRQIRWINFPFSMSQDDDLGDSHHLRTQINVSLPTASTEGFVKGETELWTFKEIGGFNGRVAVTFADDIGRPLYVISRPRAGLPNENANWHVAGHSEPWDGSSDITRDWGESVPADLLEQAAKVSIRHGAEDTTAADIFQIFCDVIGCSVGDCTQTPSAQSPPSPQNPDPCAPPTGPSPGPGGSAPPAGNAASAAGSLTVAKPVSVRAGSMSHRRPSRSWL